MLALLTGVLVVVGPLTLLFQDVPIVLARGTEIWKTDLQSLPPAIALAMLAILLMPLVAWLYGVAQVVRLARQYRGGHVFDAPNTTRFVRLGAALMVMDVLNALVMPAVNYLLHGAGISPWVADMPLLALLQPDLLMAGVFFVVLGKIMRRAAELERSDRLTI